MIRCDTSSGHQVISAQQLPKVNRKKSSIVDPLVKVEVYGVPADMAVKETRAVENNGNALYVGDVVELILDATVMT